MPPRAPAKRSTTKCARAQKTLNNGNITLLPGQKQPVVPPMPPGIGAARRAPPVRGTNAQGATAPNLRRRSAPTTTHAAARAARCDAAGTSAAHP